MGFDHSLGPLGRIGLTAAYLYGKDGKDANELISNHYEGGVYWRASAGPFNAWARGTAGPIDFDSTRNFSAASTRRPGHPLRRRQVEGAALFGDRRRVLRSAHGPAQHPPQRPGRIL